MLDKDYEWWGDDLYAYYLDALEGKKPQITNEPRPGFYRMKNGQPVAIWADEEDGEEFEPGNEPQMLVMVGSRMIEPRDHEDIWLRCCTRAVEQADWEEVAERGGVWPDMDVAVAATIGDNIGDADDPETLAELLAGLELASKAYETITDHTMAARAQSIRARALELKKRADDRRAELKAPHLAAGQAVDRAWQPLVKAGQSIADQLRKALSAWETMQLKARQRAEEERLARQAIDMPPATENAPDSQPQPASGIRGGYGRAASTRMVKKVVAIDAMQLVPWLQEHDRDTLDRFLMERAQRFVTEAFTPPGVLTEEVVDVR
jgi:hypothetical protein